MVTGPRCVACGAEIRNGAPDGHCTQCLLHLALELPAPADHSETTDLAPLLARTHSSIGIKFHRLGDYELLEEIGRGGMGVVFRARQARLNRVVALKLIQGGRLAAPTLVRRFQIEAEAAASLHHPHIVSIFEIGEQEGHHYYSMELIDGTGLDRLLSNFRPPSPPEPGSEEEARTEERQFAIARLIATMARAVDYAHQRGVLHRDLKPGNILIDREGQPHLADFGLAKLLHDDRTQCTFTGTLLGTPNYMAPELAAGQAHEATTGADIYSLGAILYELLTGQPPFQAPTPLEIWRRATEEGARNPRMVNRCINSDLATICLRCLEKDAARRYPSARALAEDLERWTAGEPILARPVTSGERLWRWGRRQPALASLAAIAGVAVVAGLLGVSTQWRRAEEASRVTRLHLYAADIALAQQALKEGNLGRGRQLLDAYRPRAGEEDLRGFEWRVLRFAAQGDFAASFLGHSNSLRALAFSSDGRWLATAGAENFVRLWDVQNRVLARTLTRHSNAVNSVAFSPDARRFATGSQGGWLNVWDTSTWQVVTQLACRPYTLDFSPVAPLIGYSEGGGINITPGRVRIWNYLTGRRIGTWPRAGSRIAFTPDGGKMVIGGERLALWDVGTGRNLWQGQEPFSTLAVAMSPCGKKFAACSFQGEVRVFDLADPEHAVLLKGPGGRARGLAFSPEGARLAVAHGDQTVRLYNVSSWERMSNSPRALRGHGNGVRCVAFSPDGQFLASGDKDGAVLLWDLKARFPAGQVTNVFNSYTSAPPVFSRDSRLVATASAVGPAAVWDLDTQQPLQTFPAMIPLALSDDRQTFTALSSNYEWQVWEVASGELRSRAAFVTATNAFTAKLSPDKKILAVGYLDGTFALWNPEDRSVRWQHRGHTNTIREFAFSPNGRILGTASYDGLAKLWDIEARRELASLAGHGDTVWTIAISPDGTTAATGSTDHTVRLWTVPDGQFLALLSGHKEGVFRVAFSPDGRTLASASDDDTVRLWHLPTRREVLRIDHPANVLTATFTPDGEMLVSISHRGLMHFYRAPNVASLGEADRRQIVGK